MALPRLNVDSFAHDSLHWGVSLVNDAELVVGCLDAARATSVVEVGAFAGDLTRLLLDWAAKSGARVGAVDPDPQPALVELAGEHDALELVRAGSLEALRTIEVPDAFVIDGDHNHYTVSRELSAIRERAAGRELPLLLFHDVCWPHARRDDYYAPETIPAEHRQPVAEGGFLFPGVEGTHRGGLPYRHPAAREGGPRNGVLTAIEDFVATDEDLRLAIVPAFFGLGAVWHARAPWADAVAAFLEPWDRNPLLERLEANRVLHVASHLDQAAQANRLRERLARQEELLNKLLISKTFAIGQLLSRLRQGGQPAYSKDEIRRLLDEEPPAATR